MNTIKDLQNNLQKLRMQLATTRPICPTETRPFTYQKPIKNGRGRETWEWVTIESTVTLRLFGVPECEHRCYDLGQQIRETKDQIIKLGYKPVEHGEKFKDFGGNSVVIDNLKGEYL